MTTAKRSSKTTRPPRPAWSPAPKRPARETVLAEWRGVDWAPLEKAQRIAARTAAQLMPAVTAKLNLDRRRAQAEIVSAWKHLIDPTLAAHAQPVGYRQGTLIVSVDSSVWLDEIVRYRQKEILDRLRLSFGPDLVKKLSFRVG